MSVRNTFDYAIVRVVPRVEREEFVNAGVILYCLQRDFLAAKVRLDEERVRALWQDADLELARSHLFAIPTVCEGGKSAGPIGELPQKDRWHWLVAPRSTIIQVSPVHSGLCDAPDEALRKLFDKMVGP